jgi:hypothetical protein
VRSGLVSLVGFLGEDDDAALLSRVDTDSLFQSYQLYPHNLLFEGSPSRGFERFGYAYLVGD